MRPAPRSRFSGSIPPSPMRASLPHPPSLSRLAIALGCAAACAVAVAGAQQPPDASVFRSGVALVSLNVTVGIR